MRISFGVDYVRDFADLCEKISASEIPDVAARIIDVLPYVIESEFGINLEKQKSRSLRLLKDRLYESALIALIPDNVKVLMTFNSSGIFVFIDFSEKAPLPAYSCKSDCHALSLLSAYLKFLADQKDLSEREKSPPIGRHLKLVSP